MSASLHGVPRHFVVTLPGDRRPLAGQQVALLGKLSLLSRRDVRLLIERLGGTSVSGLTPRTTVVVAGADAGDVPAGVRVLDEAALCQEAGLPDLETLRTQYYSARDLRGMYPSLREDHLRYLERWGLVGSVAGRFAFSDLTVIRQAATELEKGRPLHGLLRQLDADRKGQLALDFQSTRVERSPARVVALPHTGSRPQDTPRGDRQEQIAAANQALAAKYFLEGAELDDGEDRDLDQAAGAYRRAALFDPQLVPAVVNLANIHYERDEFVEAEALYEKAIRIDTDCFEAYFNLGNIHHDLGRYQEAVSAYRDALAINPTYPEAHFYLAVTLEKMGRSSDAKPHWREYRALAPNGEFVELAREFAD